VASALMQGGKELIVDPASDTHLAIGRDACSDDLSEGRFQRQLACQKLPAGRCMTCGAIAEHRKVTSAFDLLETLVSCADAAPVGATTKLAMVR
jgi:hypothetical protein